MASSFRFSAATARLSTALGALVLVAGTALAGEFPAAIGLETLNGSNGFRLDGSDAGDISGSSVASAGDVNGDGFGDLIVGAPFGAPNGDYRAGKSYVVFGKAGGFAASLDLAALDGSNGFRLDGIGLGDYSGWSVAGAGDVNGDGFGDLIIGALKGDPNGVYGAGESYVVFGKAGGFSASLGLATLDGSNGFRLDGIDFRDLSGQSVSAAGDVNGDGFDDLIIGAHWGDPKGKYNAGESYVVFGKAGGFAATFDLASLNGSNGFRLDGADQVEYSGSPVASAGDVNGDGFGDLIVGAHRRGSYVVFGKAGGFAASLDLGSLDGSNGFRLNRDWSSLAGAGDVNGDGFGDLIVGDRDAGPNGVSFAGESYVVFGQAGGFASTIGLGSLKIFRLDGTDANDQSGTSVAAAGDVNGDGFGDLIVGALFGDPNGDSYAGESYVVFGRRPDSARIRVGSAARQTINGGGFADNLQGKGGNDRLEGRGGADVLIGGVGIDTASYAHAPAGLTASLAAPASNTGHAAGDSYASIENLDGSRFADTLIGNDQANILTGGEGSDTLTGNGGRDVFRFVRASDSKKGLKRDKIADFDAGSAATNVDRIDLRAIDANTEIGGDQAFRFIGTAPFPFNKPGSVRVRLSGPNTIVSGDVNGDQVSDFDILLENFTGLANLTGLDFMR